MKDISDDIKNKIIDFYLNKNYSKKRLCDEFGISNYQINTIFTKNNISLRNRQFKNALTGKIIGDYVVISFVDKGKYKYYWKCKCVHCGTEKDIASTTLLTNNKRKMCKCNPDYFSYIDNKGYLEDFTGKEFGKLKVLEFSHVQNSHSYWKCQCKCGEVVIKNISYLKNSKILMCDNCKNSVIKKEINKVDKVKIPFEKIPYQRKENTVEYFDDYALINNSVLVDSEDVEKIFSFKRYVSKNSLGYPYVNWKSKEFFIHRLVMNLPQYYDDCSKIIVDHINGNKLDNRKSNLRICEKSKNPINCKRYSNNKSGKKGVFYNKKLNKWEVGIQYEGKSMYLGVYSEFEEAVKVRECAERKYFKEFNRKEGDSVDE